MIEDAMNGHRVVAWMDGLTDEERIHVQRLSELPENMRVGYVWVDFSRRMDALEEEHRDAMRAGMLMRNAASGFGGAVILAVAYLGHAMGLDKMLR